MWERINYNNTELWQLRNWRKYNWLVHGFTNNTAGNLALHVLDNKTKVIENRKSLSKKLGLKLDNWVTGHQVHNCNIKVVKKIARGKGAWDIKTAFSNTDGLVTNENKVFLASFYADCVPLFFMEPSCGIIGVAHAGWRGTSQGMATKVITHIKKHFQIDLASLQVAIGPSIGPCCYEIGEEIMPNFPSEVITRTSTSLYLDLWQENKRQFLASGLKERNIFMPPKCTACSEEFYSYRRDKTPKRMAAFMCIL